MKRDAGRKTVQDTSKKEIVDGKYKPYVEPKNVINMGVEPIEEQANKSSSTSNDENQSLVIRKMQEDLRKITTKQYKAGKLLMESKKNRVDGLIWMGTCSVIGSMVFAVSDGSVGANVLGGGIFLLGGAMSITKIVQAFNKVESAGKTLYE